MKSASPDTAYTLEIQIQATDIDLLGHVNNVVYLRYVQEAAIAHWTAAADPADQERFFWVVTRHEIDYRRPAFLKDTILARTWVGKSEKGLFERFTELARKRDGKILASARTLWCPVDPATKRQVEVSPTVYARFSSEG